ncbi:MAG: TM2 domain-containing protein [Pseudomonadota bacterium]
MEPVAAQTHANMLFCSACGKQIHQSATACPGCGAVQRGATINGGPAESDKRIVPALLLCFFLGWLGVHRFYVGKVGTGILMILTFGGLGLWTLIDFIMIVIGSFRDAEGKLLNQWT